MWIKFDNFFISNVEESPFGPLTQRLVSALIEENIMTPMDDTMNEITGGKGTAGIFLKILKTLIKWEINVLKWKCANLTKVRPRFTLSQRGSDNSQYWSYSNELCCLNFVFAYCVMMSTNLNPMQHYLRWWKSFCCFIFMSTQACSLGQKEKASKIPSGA